MGVRAALVIGLFATLASFLHGGVYAAGQDFIVKKPFEFIITKGKKEGENFAGYDVVAEKLAHNVASWIDQRKKGKVK